MPRVDIAAPEEFNSEEDANAWRDAYYNSWHPLGYGTVIHVKQSEKTGKWVADGYRWDSCD